MNKKEIISKVKFRLLQKYTAKNLLPSEEIINDCIDNTLKAINYTRCCDKLPKSDIILARYLHDSYELIAKKQDWNTQENCKVQFSDLPIENKNTMIFLAGKIIQDFGGN